MLSFNIESQMVPAGESIENEQLEAAHRGLVTPFCGIDLSAKISLGKCLRDYSNY